MFISQITFESERQEGLFDKALERKSICFLLGEDKKDYRYFELAEQHFLNDPNEKTDVVVKSCRSLEDVIHYLNNVDIDSKWGTIQIVAHGNPYSGLSLPIYNDGPRATVKNLLKTLMDNPLDSVRTLSIDNSTRINFWGCGIGKNPFINMALDSFFRLPDNSKPNIYTSPHFVIFKEDAKGLTKRIKSTYWPYIFNRGYRPSDEQIARDMKAQYPNEEINWIDALDQSSDEEFEGAFENSFHIPVSWTVIYPDKNARPDISTHIKKMNWIRSQPQLMDQIVELNIPLRKFTWTINKVIHTNKDGSKSYAIKAIGMSTILCVLVPE